MVDGAHLFSIQVIEQKPDTTTNAQYQDKKYYQLFPGQNIPGNNKEQGRGNEVGYNDTELTIVKLIDLSGQNLVGIIFFEYVF